MSYNANALVDIEGHFSYKWSSWQSKNKKMLKNNIKEEDKTNYRIFKEL